MRPCRFVHEKSRAEPLRFRPRFFMRADDICFFLNSTFYILHSTFAPLSSRAERSVPSCHPERSEAFLPVILSGAKRSRRISLARPQQSPAMRSLDKLGMTGVLFVLSLAKTYLGASPKLFAKDGAGGKQWVSRIKRSPPNRAEGLQIASFQVRGQGSLLKRK